MKGGRQETREDTVRRLGSNIHRNLQSDTASLSEAIREFVDFVAGNNIDINDFIHNINRHPQYNMDHYVDPNFGEEARPVFTEQEMRDIQHRFPQSLAQLRETELLSYARRLARGFGSSGGKKKRKSKRKTMRKVKRKTKIRRQRKHRIGTRKTFWWR